VAFRYVGEGWVPGIPARDLTWEEAKALGLEVIRKILDPHTGEVMYEELPSDTRLDNFGISAEAVKKKIEERSKT
jgi:hypothetical protein